MKASPTPKSIWQQYLEDTWEGSSSLATVLPDCPVLRSLTVSVLRVQSEVLKGSLLFTEFLLSKLEPPAPPRSEKITIE